MVTLNEGPVVTVQLTNLGNGPVRIGMPVEMVTRKIRNDGDERGMIVYGYKFRPVMQNWNLLKWKFKPPSRDGGRFWFNVLMYVNIEN